MALTEKRIRDAKPGQKTRIDWDGEVKGLLCGKQAELPPYEIRTANLHVLSPARYGLATVLELADHVFRTTKTDFLVYQRMKFVSLACRSSTSASLRSVMSPMDPATR